MHLGIPALLNFFRTHRDEEALVLATIIGTEGSTYRKAGAMMLIARDGEFEGMISGGCLEGDLLHHAENVFVTGETAFVTYDMHAGEDLVWGLGVGCDGVIRLMLQRLDREQNFGFLGQLETSQQTRCASLLALSVEPATGLPCGTYALLDRSDISEGDPLLLGSLRAVAEPWPEWRINRVKLDSQGGEISIIQINVSPQIRVLVCGAGPDAVPVVQSLCGLDWDVTVVDHRPGFTKPERFPAACTVVQARPEKLHEAIDLSGVDAVVIMSHHLENDSLYLGQVASHDIPYVGVLGPGVRKQRLRSMAGCEELPVRGPAGLDIGAELPTAIALSIAAEIHAVLNRRDGLSLTLKTDDKD